MTERNNAFIIKAAGLDVGWVQCDVFMYRQNSCYTN